MDVVGHARKTQTKPAAFGTESVDLTDDLDDPVDVLFGVQLGGGTDINRARSYDTGHAAAL